MESLSNIPEFHHSNKLTPCTERKKILFQDEYLKILLIHWSGFQQSDKHGHPGEGGLIKVLSGMLLETRFDPKHPEHRIGSYLYAEGDVAYIHDDIALHTVENPLSIPAVSLHCYVLQKREKNTVERKSTDIGSNALLSSAA